MLYFQDMMRYKWTTFAIVLVLLYIFLFDRRLPVLLFERHLPIAKVGAPVVENITVVTACSLNHADALFFMLRSLAALNVKVFLYDLGIPPVELLKLQALHSQLHIRKFNYSAYPSYMDIRKNAGEYAWKPVIIAQVARELIQTKANSVLLWVDAGCYFRSLNAVVRKTQQDGLYIGKSRGTVQKWTHPAMFAYFNQSKDIWGHYHQVEASIVGLRLDSVILNKIILPWESCALTKACIAPEGSSRKNHRQDQSVLTYLVYASWVPGGSGFNTGIGVNANVKSTTPHDPSREVFNLNFKLDNFSCKCDRNIYKYTGYFLIPEIVFEYMCGSP